MNRHHQREGARLAIPEDPENQRGDVLTASLRLCLRAARVQSGTDPVKGHGVRLLIRKVLGGFIPLLGEVPASPGLGLVELRTRLVLSWS